MFSGARATVARGPPADPLDAAGGGDLDGGDAEPRRDSDIDSSADDPDGCASPGPATSRADFVFGTLATDDLRLAQIRAASSGVHHVHDLEPPDPRPGEPVAVAVTVGGRVHADHVTCYYTTDGSDPAGDRGRADARHGHRARADGVSPGTP